MTLGYVGTTVEAIAAEAGVAVATVYKAFGTKAAIARELNDLIDEEAHVAAHTERIAQASLPTELIAAAVALNVSLHVHCGDIIQATRAGAAVDPALGCMPRAPTATTAECAWASTDSTSPVRSAPIWS